MIHGDAVSAGCLAMGDEAIDDALPIGIPPLPNGRP